jgi:antitoxin ParD1/3/4
MASDSLNLALPEDLKEFLGRQVAEGGYTDASEYIGELLRADRARKSHDRLEALIAEGISSGDAGEMTDADWDELKDRVRQREAERSR